MKLQDIIFFVILIFLIWRRDSRLTAVFGLIALVLSIPLFASWTFFTAERLTWYAAAFFLLAIILQIWQLKKNGR